jgi:caffeoyl-CoA O-methyltransferase
MLSQIHDRHVLADLDLTSLPSVTGQFDLIFLDANKDGYVDYLQKIIELKLLAPNGVILADNALFAGLVANKKDNPAAADAGRVGRSEPIDRFNKFVKEHEELENVLVPAFDGLNMIRFKNPERQ